MYIQNYVPSLFPPIPHPSPPSPFHTILKAKKVQQEREKAQRILEMEVAESTEINPRQQERERLRAILMPLGLVIKDINPDGHCLYAAISDQLSVKTKIKVGVFIVIVHVSWCLQHCFLVLVILGCKH